MEQVLVFASSIQMVDRIIRKLDQNDIAADPIHSRISQGGRQNTLNDFKSGRIKVLVTTDLLARGIDIDFLPYVINFELPRSPKDFIHRIGRTGRADKQGEAITFVSPDEEHHFKVIQKKMKKWVDRVNIDDVNL
jgi:ATP-dependent RNA helicase RhlE